MADLVGGLYLVDTTEPLRLGYDDSGAADVSLAVSSAGALTITPESGQFVAMPGKLFVGTTVLTNANMTTGITVHGGTADDQHFCLRNSDVDHGCTTVTANPVTVNDFFTLAKLSSTAGGVRQQGISETTQAYQLIGYHRTDDTDKTTAALAPFNFIILRHDGANALTDNAATANLFVVRGTSGGVGATRFIFDMAGKMYSVGGTSTAVYGPEIRIAATAKVRLDGSDSGDTYVHEVSANVLELVAGTEGYRATTTFFGPSEDDNKDCGASGNRWNDVFATNTTIQTSDAREKKDIRPLDQGLAFLRTLNPVAYKFKTGKRDHWGFVAQDIAASLGSLDVGLYIEPKDGSPVGLRYNELLAPTVLALQELDVRLSQLESGLLGRIWDAIRKLFTKGGK